MRYNRSNTRMDDDSQFFPQSFLSGLRAVNPETGEYYVSQDEADAGVNVPNYGTVPGAVYYPTMRTEDFPTSGGLYQPYSIEPSTIIGNNAGGSGPGAGAGSGDWVSLFKSAPTMLRDLLLANDARDYNKKLLDINLERARRNQPPLDPQRYAPGVNVGLAPQTQKFLGVGVGTLALGGLALWFLARRR